jgi:hypothetical protein
MPRALGMKHSAPTIFAGSPRGGVRFELGTKRDYKVVCSPRDIRKPDAVSEQRSAGARGAARGLWGPIAVMGLERARLHAASVGKDFPSLPYNPERTEEDM